MKLSLVTGALAAFAALLNAVASIFAGWRDNRWLRISLVPDEFAHGIALSEWYPFNLTIVNPAKSANFIREVQCWIDSNRQSVTTEPNGLFTKPIDGYQQVAGRLLLPAQRVVDESYERMRITFVPIRGRRRTFKFKRSDLVHPF